MIKKSICIMIGILCIAVNFDSNGFMRLGQKLLKKGKETKRRLKRAFEKTTKKTGRQYTTKVSAKKPLWRKMVRHLTRPIPMTITAVTIGSVLYGGWDTIKKWLLSLKKVSYSESTTMPFYPAQSESMLNTFILQKTQPLEEWNATIEWYTGAEGTRKNTYDVFLPNVTPPWGSAQRTGIIVLRSNADRTIFAQFFVKMDPEYKSATLESVGLPPYDQNSSDTRSEYYDKLTGNIAAHEELLPYLGKFLEKNDIAYIKNETNIEKEATGYLPPFLTTHGWQKIESLQKRENIAQKRAN